MSHEMRQIVTVHRDAENLAPSFVFLHPARIDKGWMMLFSEGSPTLEGKWTLTQERDGQTTTTEYVCAMPDSYQNFPVLDVPDVFVQAGDRFDFSVNDPECVCAFAIEAYAHDWLVPAPEPEPEPTPVDEAPEAA